MTTQRLTILCIIGTLLLWAGSASAQGRSSVSISNIGRGTQIGDTAASRTFRDYSSDVGSLSRSSAGGGTSVLRSSLRTGSMGVTRRSRLATSRTDLGNSALDSTSGRPTISRGADYGSGGSTLIRSGGYGGGVSALGSLARSDPLYGTRAFLSAVKDDDRLKTDRREPITSLVPDEPSKYQEYLAKGERYFKAAKYTDALGWFEMAGVFDGDDPESLLSLTHTKTALEEYPSAAFTLRKAIRSFPELPVLPLQPRGFYGDPLDYTDQMAKLREYVSKNTFDADGHLLLAYYNWFEGNIEQAKESMQTAHLKAKDLRGKTRESVAEAIDILWKGMVATGKVSDTLGEEPDPAQTTTQPADDEKDPSADSAKG
ncbi:MAG: tetratricopeptide repeat protein [Planctomycetota bacterium]